MEGEQRLVAIQYSMMFMGFAYLYVILDWDKKQVSFEVQSNRMCDRFNLFVTAVDALEKEREWLESRGNEVK